MIYEASLLRWFVSFHHRATFGNNELEAWFRFRSRQQFHCHYVENYIMKTEHIVDPSSVYFRCKENNTAPLKETRLCV